MRPISEISGDQVKTPNDSAITGSCRHAKCKCISNYVNRYSSKYLTYKIQSKSFKAVIKQLLVPLTIVLKLMPLSLQSCATLAKCDIAESLIPWHAAQSIINLNPNQPEVVAG